MQKHILRAALLLSLLLVFAKPLLASNVTLIMPGQADTTAPAQLRPDQYPLQPALFKFTHGDSTVYLFGTAHSVVKGVKWRTNEFNRAIGRADRIWFESTFRQMFNPVLLFDLIMSFKNEDGKRIEDILSKEEMAKLRKVAREQNFDLDEYSEFHPWFISDLLSGAHYKAAVKKDKKQEVEMVPGVEHIIEVIGMGKPVMALEDTRKTMLLYSRLSPADEKALLMDTVDQMDKSNKEIITDVMDAWSKGDLDRIDRLDHDSRENTPGLYKIMLTERNKGMFDKIVTILNGSGTDFVGVGAAHVAGPGGLVSMLEKAGYKAERIYDTEPPVASDTERGVKIPHYRANLLWPMELTVSLVNGSKPDEAIVHLARGQTFTGCAEYSPLKTKIVKAEGMVDVSVYGYFRNIHPYPDTDGCGPAVKTVTTDIPLDLTQLKKDKVTYLKLTSQLGYAIFTLTYKDGTLTIAPRKDRRKRDQLSVLFILDNKKLTLTGI